MSIDLAGRRIAIIGGAGFIGHNMALEMVRRGAEVHVLDSLQVNNLGAYSHKKSGNPNAELYVMLIQERLDLLRAAGVQLHVVDARDYQLLSPHLNEIAPDAVVHLPPPTPIGRTRIPTARSIIPCGLLRTRWIAPRGQKPHFIYFRPRWSTAISRARR